MIFQLHRSAFALALLSAVTVMFSTSSMADEAKGMEKMAEITLKDQFDKTQKIDQSTKLVLFAHDMGGNDLLEEALADYDNDKLSAKNIVYLADISGMPSLIGRLFALPAMRKRPYSMMLDREGDISAAINAKEDQITVIYLNQLTIDKTEHLATAESIKQVLSKQ